MRKMKLLLSAGLGLVAVIALSPTISSPATAGGISKLGIVANMVERSPQQNIWLAHSPRNAKHGRRHWHRKKKVTRHPVRRHYYGRTHSRRYSRHDLRIDLYDYWDIFTSGMGR